MEDKIRILFHNIDGAGVNYFRTLTPAQELERNHSDMFYVEINPSINFDDPQTMDYLKSFHIIHYHRQLVGNPMQMVEIAKELKKNGTILIVDIDDYWKLHKKHPFYQMSIEQRLDIPVIQNLKIADYVTTTTELFAEEIRTITGKDNVMVFANSVDPTWMKQFQNNWKPDPDGRVRISYAAGSSHQCDIEQLEGITNVLNSDYQLRDKFKIIIAGFDAEGSTTEVTFNDDFGKELRNRGLLTKDMVKSINNSRGDIDKISKLPKDMIERYRNNIFTTRQRDIRSDESVYLYYENVLTDNHKIIKDPDYVEWLKNLERNVMYDNEGIYGRRWTEKANLYAKVLDETDIVIAPLEDNPFNRMKSNLKQVECWTRKLPIVCSDIPPYNVYGKHMENCVLIPSVKNAYKYWQKYLKRLILDADLRKNIGEGLYQDFKDEFNLANVTKKRAEFYKKIIDESLEVK